MVMINIKLYYILQTGKGFFSKPQKEIKLWKDYYLDLIPMKEFGFELCEDFQNYYTFSYSKNGNDCNNIGFIDQETKDMIVKELTKKESE